MSKQIGRVALIAAILALGAWLIWLRPPFLGGTVSYLAVTGSSMEPGMHGGDLAVLRHQSAYDVGDIIAYRADGGLIIHRIVGGNADEGYVVQGDNKDHTDAWTPKPQDIVGTMWARIPMLGLVGSHLREPAMLGGIIGVTSILSLVGAGGAHVRRHRRRLQGSTLSGHLRLPSAGTVGLATVALLAAASGSVAAYAYTRPLTSERFVEHGRIEQSGAFDYTVRLQPSSLYNSTVISAADLAPSNSEAKGTRLYANLVRGLDLRFSYGLRAPWSAPAGEYSADLVITAERGWTKTLPLVSPTPFSGGAVEFGIPIDLQQVLGLIQQIQEETAFKPPAYDLSVVPRVRAWDAARTNGSDSSEVHSPSFPIRLNGNEIALGSELQSSQSRVIGETVRNDTTVEFLGLRTGIATLRLLGLVGLIVALLPTAILAALFIRARRPHGEEARLARRDRVAIIPVTAEVFPASTVRIRVASLQELARFAQREDRSIFHAEPAPGWHRYFVVTDTVTCEYEVV